MDKFIISKDNFKNINEHIIFPIEDDIVLNTFKEYQEVKSIIEELSYVVSHSFLRRPLVHYKSNTLNIKHGCFVLNDLIFPLVDYSVFSPRLTLLVHEMNEMPTTKSHKVEIDSKDLELFLNVLDVTKTNFSVKVLLHRE